MIAVGKECERHSWRASVREPKPSPRLFYCPNLTVLFSNGYDIAMSKRKDKNKNEPPETLPIRKGRMSQLEKLLKYDNERYKKMLVFIKSGVYAHVAAGVLNVMPDTFCRWLRLGEKHYYEQKKSSPYRQFYIDVYQAFSEARQLAETQVFVDNPLTWLRQTARSRLSPKGNMLPGWDAESQHLLIENAAMGDMHNPENVADEKTIIEALKVLDEMGAIKITESGQQLLANSLQDDEEDEEEDEEGSGEVIDVPFDKVEKE